MTYENWVTSTATILSCSREDTQSRSPASLFVGHFTVDFSYAFEGKHYRGRFHSSHAWEDGSEVGILYNPGNPVESCACDEDESRTVAVLECALQLLEFL